MGIRCAAICMTKNKAGQGLPGLLLCVDRYSGRDFTMYIHRRASQRSGKLMTNYD